MLTAPHSEIASLRSDMQRLARGDVFMRPIAKEVTSLLKEEFAKSEGPYGEWQETKRGKPALLSKKLPNAFKTTIEGKSITVSGRVARDWLKAHQEGRTFASRQVADRQNVLRFNSRGKLTKASRFEKLKKGRAVLAKAHTVGQRVLPARPIVPEGKDLPAKWEERFADASTRAMNDWYEKAVK